MADLCGMNGFPSKTFLECFLLDQPEHSEREREKGCVIDWK